MRIKALDTTRRKIPSHSRGQTWRRFIWSLDNVFPIFRIESNNRTSKPAVSAETTPSILERSSVTSLNPEDYISYPVSFSQKCVLVVSNFKTFYFAIPPPTLTFQWACKKRSDLHYMQCFTFWIVDSRLKNNNGTVITAFKVSLDI